MLKKQENQQSNAKALQPLGGTMKGLLRVTCLALMGVFFAGPLWANSPSTVRIEVKITDPNTGLLNGVSPVVVRLYESSSSTTAVWTESKSAVNFSNGVFSMELGTETPFTKDIVSLPTALFGITIDNNPEFYIPVNAVPYSLKSKWADEVLTFNWASANVMNTPNVSVFPGTLTDAQLPDSVIASRMIGTGAVLDSHITGPISANKISGSISSSNLGAGVISGTNIANSTLTNTNLAEGSFASIIGLGNLTSTLNLNAGSGIFIPSRFQVDGFTGQVGVNLTGSPTAYLDVNGDVRFREDMRVSGDVYLPADLGLISDNSRLLTVSNGLVRQVDVSAWDRDSSNDVTTFLGLTDTPSSYSGAATYLLRVNAAGTALEFVPSLTVGDASSLGGYVAADYLRTGAAMSFSGGSFNVASGSTMNIQTGAGLNVEGNLLIAGQPLGSVAFLNTVGENQLAANSVVSSKILTSAVITSKIADLAITEGKLADNSVTSLKISTDAITADKILNGSITADKLAAGAVGASSIGTGSIDATKLSADSVTSAKIVDGAISNSKLAAGNYTNITGVGTLSGLTVASGISSTTGNFTVVTGTAPFTVTSTTKVDNLNVDTLDGLDSTAFLQVSNNFSDIYNAATARTNLGLGALATPSTVGAAQIDNGAITADKLAAGAVSAASIDTGSIDATKLAADSVTSAKIVDGAISNSKLAAGSYTNITGVGTLSGLTVASGVDAVTGNFSVVTGTAPFTVTSTTKVANLNVDTLDGLDSTAFLQVSNNFSDINNVSTARTNLGLGALATASTVGAAQIDNGAITADKLAAGAVGASSIDTGSIDATKLADDAVTSGKIADGAVSNANLASGAYANITGVGTLTGLTVAGSVTAGNLSVGNVSGEAFSGNSVSVATGNFSVATGTAPFTVTSTTKVANLNVDNLDGLDSTAFLQVSNNFSDINNAATARTNLGLGSLALLNSVTTTEITDGTISAGDLASDSVTTVKILDSNVTTAKVADSAITAEKLGTDAVTTVKILDSNVTTAKVADSAITAAKIGTDAVTTVKILDSNVTTAKIADSAITAVKLGTDAVTTFKILDSNVTTAKVADSAITAAKLGTDAVTTVKILDSNVTTAKIADASVTTAKIANNAVDSTKLAPNAVTTNAITDLNVTTGKIADSAITAAKIGTDAVTTVKILDSNVTTAKIANNAVTSGKLGVSAVTTNAIADLNVTTAKIANNAVTSGKLGVSAVTTNAIADLNVTTAKIADSAVTSAKILDGSITGADILDGTITSAKLSGTLDTLTTLAVSGTTTLAGTALTGFTVSKSEDVVYTGITGISTATDTFVFEPGAGNTNPAFRFKGHVLIDSNHYYKGSSFNLADNAYALKDSDPVYIGFSGANNSIVGSLSGQNGGDMLNGIQGVKLESAGADYAEYLPHLNANESINKADVVGVFGGKISRNTAGADRVMVVSTMPIVLGNWKPSDNVKASPVAFVGQVPVRVKGAVKTGDYIIATGLGDGMAIAKSAADMTADDIAKTVGQAWETKSSAGTNVVNVALLPDGVAKAVLATLAKDNKALRSEMDAMRKDIEAIKAALKK